MADAASILHVDDDADVRLIVDMSLRLDGNMQVISVASAEDMLARLRNDGVASHPDAIIMDCRIGGTNGLCLLDQINGIRGAARIPVIFLTARAMAKDRSAMLAAGAAGVLVKPFNPLTLAKEVRALITSRGTP